MQVFYLPNIAYFQHLLQMDEPQLHLNDTYSRQTFKNRTEIVGPNGKMLLSIPTQKLDPNHRQYSNIKISYSENWLNQHWKSFESAYRRSAYFEYYEDNFRFMYEKPSFEYLWEFNFELIKIIYKLLKLDKDLVLNKIEKAPRVSEYLLLNPKRYQQVFSNKVEFIPNLSIIDLIFNVGPQTKAYLIS